MYISRNYLLSAFILPAGLIFLYPADAYARGVPVDGCMVNTATIGSVTIGNINKAPEINSILSFSCSLKKPIEPGRRLAYCWHIHDAPGGAAKFTYRYAKLGKDKVSFNIYSHGLKVGDRRTPNNIIGIPTKLNEYSYRVDDPITIRFEGNAGATSLQAGLYRYDNPKTHFTAYSLLDTDELNYKNACGTDNGDVLGNAKFGNTNINISVRTYCNIHVSKDLAFLKQVKLDRPIKANATVNVDCSAGTDYQVKIDKGHNYFDNMRHMAAQHGTKEMVAYTISPEEWTGIGFGTPQGQDWIIDGTVPVQDTPSAGAYKDVLIVNIAWQEQG